MESLSDRIAGLACMSAAELRLEWERLWRSPAPRIANDLLARGIAYKMQEQVYGSLPASVLREIERVGTAGTAVPSAPAKPSIRPGARLIRTWQGRTISVEVTDDGYRWEDRPYRSLSRIAREVTGVQWSGPRFFGLTSNG